MLIDVTQHKAVEAQLQRAERLETIGHLASGIAHDMNNILAPILLGVPLLRRQHKPEDRETTLRRIEISARRGADLVKQLLAMGRGDNAVRTIVDVSQIISEVARISGEIFPKSIQIAIACASDLWPVRGSASQLHQLMLNLCVNARDAMPNGGELRIRAENLRCDENYTVLSQQLPPGDYLRVRVTDTGVGMSPEVQARIFDSFFTTKASGKGTGLGLSTVATVVRAHDGRVTVESAVGEGTTFEILLPAVAGGDGREPVDEAEPPRGNGELVLVVDDEDAVRVTMRETLLGHGYGALTATDGADALVVFSRSPSIKLVITDIDMPMMDGTSLVRALRRLEPDLSIVISTGLGMFAGDQQRRREIEALGAISTLPKPYRAHDLLTAVQNALSKRVRMESLPSDDR